MSIKPFKELQFPGKIDIPDNEKMNYNERIAVKILHRHGFTVEALAQLFRKDIKVVEFFLDAI